MPIRTYRKNKPLVGRFGGRIDQSVLDVLLAKGENVSDICRRALEDRARALSTAQVLEQAKGPVRRR